MIVVTRLNDSQFAINPDLIERIHQAPDTTIVMVDGRKYIVTESMSEVIEMIAAYRARVVAMATQIPSPLHQSGSRWLELASSDQSDDDPRFVEHEPARPTPIQSKKI
ncbi:MAG: flagellar FlbD family protein [Homoserinimonas sp.]